MTYISEFTNATSHMHDYFAVKVAKLRSSQVSRRFRPPRRTCAHGCAVVAAPAQAVEGASPMLMSLRELCIVCGRCISSGANKLLLR